MGCAEIFPPIMDSLDWVIIRKRHSAFHVLNVDPVFRRASDKYSGMSGILRIMSGVIAGDC